LGGRHAGLLLERAHQESGRAIVGDLDGNSHKRNIDPIGAKFNRKFLGDVPQAKAGTMTLGYPLGAGLDPRAIGGLYSLSPAWGNDDPRIHP
jgi:hypothetical protein